MSQLGLGCEHGVGRGRRCGRRRMVRSYPDILRHCGRARISARLHRRGFRDRRVREAERAICSGSSARSDSSIGCSPVLVRHVVRHRATERAVVQKIPPGSGAGSVMPACRPDLRWPDI